MKSYNAGQGEDDPNDVQQRPKHNSARGDTDNEAVGIEHDVECSPRTCKECNCRYTIAQFRQSSSNYFEPPYNYREGCKDYCLKCWLGVGPKDFPAGT
jgi:hypothetical protein